MGLRPRAVKKSFESMDVLSVCAGSHRLRMDIPQTSQGINYDIRSTTPNSTCSVGSVMAYAII